jgi:hypothetical protein
MRKLFLLLFAFTALSLTAQEQTTCSQNSMYVGFGFSMASVSNFEYGTSFPSVEVGFTRNDVSYGVAFGRASLKGLGNSEDVLQNYFYELKVVPSLPLGPVNANLILGMGGYIDSQDFFVEYGFGLSKSFGNVSIGLSYTNWDRQDYVTPSVSFSF